MCFENQNYLCKHPLYAGNKLACKQGKIYYLMRLPDGDIGVFSNFDGEQLAALPASAIGGYFDLPKQAVLMNTPLGALVAQPAGDDAHPGISVSLVAEDGVSLQLALIEYADDEADVDEAAIFSRVYGDNSAAEYSDRVVHKGINEALDSIRKKNNTIFGKGKESASAQDDVKLWFRMGAELFLHPEEQAVLADEDGEDNCDIFRKVLTEGRFCVTGETYSPNSCIGDVLKALSLPEKQYESVEPSVELELHSPVQPQDGDSRVMARIGISVQLAPDEARKFITTDDFDLAVSIVQNALMAGKYSFDGNSYIPDEDCFPNGETDICPIPGYTPLLAK